MRASIRISLHVVAACVAGFVALGCAAPAKQADLPGLMRRLDPYLANAPSVRKRAEELLLGTEPPVLISIYVAQIPRDYGVVKVRTLQDGVLVCDDYTIDEETLTRERSYSVSSDSARAAFQDLCRQVSLGFEHLQFEAMDRWQCYHIAVTDDMRGVTIDRGSLYTRYRDEVAAHYALEGECGEDDEITSRASKSAFGSIAAYLTDAMWLFDELCYAEYAPPPDAIEE